MGLLDEVLGQVLGGGMQGQAQPQGRSGGQPTQADAGLGGILDMLLRGGDPAGGAAPGGTRAGPGGGLGDFVEQALGGGSAGPGHDARHDGMDARERAAKSAAKTQAKLEQAARERAEDAREAAQQQRHQSQGQAGGLDWLMDQFQRAGHGEAAQSWVGAGANRSLSGRQIEDALGRDMVDQLARRSGLSRDSMLDQLAQVLPQAIDRLTPGGRMPTHDERGRW